MKSTIKALNEFKHDCYLMFCAFCVNEIKKNLPLLVLTIHKISEHANKKFFFMWQAFEFAIYHKLSRILQRKFVLTFVLMRCT